MEATVPATSVTVGNDHRHHNGDHERIEWLRNLTERGFTADALASCKTDDGVAEQGARVRADICTTQKQISDAATATVVGFKDAQATAYQIEGRALLEAAKNANAAAVMATMFANAASVEATKNASAAELRAQVIASAAAAQLAECCCDLKALVTGESEKTRDLINANVTQELRDRLLATQRLIPVTIPVGA